MHNTTPTRMLHRSEYDVALEEFKKTDYNRNKNTNKSCCGRAIKIALSPLFVIPYIIINIGSGIMKGLEVSTVHVINLSYKLGMKMADRGTRCSVACGFVGLFVGTIVTAIVVAPCLVLGAVFGLCHAASKFPKTMQQYFERGCCVATRKILSSYAFCNKKLSINTSLYSS